MDLIIRYTPLSLAFIGSLHDFVTGKQTNVFEILLIMMVFDVISGLLKAAKERRLRSHIMTWGLLKKVGSLLAVMLGILLDVYLNDKSPLFATAAAFYVIGTEGLSVVENLVAIGVPVPNLIKERLMDMTKESNVEYSDESRIVSILDVDKRAKQEEE